MFLLFHIPESMRNFFKFLLRNSNTLLFLGLEILCFVMVVSFNDYQRSSFLSSANRISGSIYASTSRIYHFFSLVDENKILSVENVRLRNQLNEWKAKVATGSIYRSDTLPEPQYFYRDAKVVNNSVNKARNFMTIDKGRGSGIVKDMAVVSPQGVVGTVWNTSDNFATVIPLINTQLKISGRLKSTNYFGSIEWDGLSPRFVWLTEIPIHAPVSMGDSVVTSGFSSIFPDDLLIGEVEDVETDKGGGFYNIKVKLAVDFQSVSYVEVIENRLQNEQIQLEKKEAND